MSRYEVDVEQTLTYKVAVEAETAAEARKLAENRVIYGEVWATSSTLKSDAAQVVELRKRFP